MAVRKKLRRTLKRLKTIEIGESTVTICEVSGNRVKVLVEAPDGVTVTWDGEADPVEVTAESIDIPAPAA